MRAEIKPNLSEKNLILFIGLDSREYAEIKQYFKPADIDFFSYFITKMKKEGYVDFEGDQAYLTKKGRELYYLYQLEEVTL